MISRSQLWIMRNEAFVAMIGKESRHIFELALEKAELRPEEVWYVGDQYRCDVVGAQGIGMFPVWYVGAIDLKYEPVEGVLTVENWQELKEYLKECL